MVMVELVVIIIIPAVVDILVMVAEMVDMGIGVVLMMVHLAVVVQVDILVLEAKEGKILVVEKMVILAVVVLEVVVDAMTKVITMLAMAVE